VGAAKRADRSTTTFSISASEVAERSVSMPERDAVRSERMVVKGLVCREMSSLRSSMSRLLTSGADGDAKTASGSMATERNLKNCMMADFGLRKLGEKCFDAREGCGQV